MQLSIKSFIYLFFITILLGASPAYSQNRVVDSLKVLLNNASDDTTRLRVLYSLVENITDDAVWPQYNEAMLSLSEKLSQTKDTAIQRKAKKYLSGALNNIGYLSRMQGDIQKALEFYFKGLKIQEELHLEDDIALSINNIGAVYVQQSQYQKAIECFERALKQGQKLNDKNLMALTLGNISSTYRKLGLIEKSFVYDFKSLALWKELGNNHYVCAVQNNIGVTYLNKGEYAKAFDFFNKSLVLSRQIGSKHQETISLYNIGDAYLRQGNYKEALGFMTSSLQLAQKKGNVEDTRDAAKLLAEIQQHMGNHKEALSTYRLHVAMRDSMFNKETRKRSIETQFQYEFDKKEATLKAISEEEASKQRLVRNVLIVGLMFVIMLAFAIYRNFRNKKKAHEIITAQKHLVDEKNREILDSINYAKRIQTAILPGAELIKAHFSDYFIYYKPKDIVSGDFYSLIKKENHIVIAAADCTGHGVPGALMSMIGSNMLNQAIIEHGITDPSLILGELNQSVSDTLKQNDAGTNDGMDIALCSIDLSNYVLEYAGANRPLWIFSDRKLSDRSVSITDQQSFTAVAPTKSSIGGHTETDHLFENHKIALQKGDTMYLFSDGFADQFGGPDGKKLMTKRFKEMLVSIQRLDMPEQEDAVNKVFEAWKGSREQVDDVLVIGIRV